MSRKPKTKPPRRWPMTATESEAVRSLLSQRAIIERRVAAVWADAAKRVGVPVETDIVVGADCSAWVERRK